MMKILAAVAMVLTYCISASSYCVTVIQEPKPSLQNAQITVLADEKLQDGVKLTVTLPNGEVRSFVTDSHGTAMLKNLPAGTNCIKAVGEDYLVAYLCLAVSKDSSPETSAFTLTLFSTLGPLPAISAARPDVLRQLEMVVQDASGGVVEHAEVRVYAPQSYPKNPLVKAWTDQYGRLVPVPLNPGSYAVTVRSPGFKPAVRVIEISPEGDGYPVRGVLQPGSC